MKEEGKTWKKGKRSASVNEEKDIKEKIKTNSSFHNFMHIEMYEIAEKKLPRIKI